MDISLYDFAAFIWFLVCWTGYTLYADSSERNRDNLISSLHDHRVKWMERMLTREMRMADVAIISAHSRSVGLFASTTIFILAGLVTLFGAVDRARALVSDFSFVTQVSREMWEIKLLLLLLIFVYAFFKFAWSLRQFNFSLILIGSAPTPSEVDAPDRVDFPNRTAGLITRGVNTFNRGLRAYYFGLAALSWFIHPAALVICTVWVVLVLYRREFRSATLKDLRGSQINPDTPI